MRLLILTLLSLFTILVSGHARIKIPPPLDAPAEDPTGNAYNAPLAASGSEFPCKNLHKKAGVDKTPKQSWRAGFPALFEILGHVTSGEGALAAHSGGSCQASISYDNGITFRALHSFHGGCPRGVALNSNHAGPNQTFNFAIPPQAKAGPALFAWTWIAATGNRDEFYMNCAAVEITGTGTSTLDDYPNMYVGEMNIPGQIATGECRSTAGTALLYPNPGPADRVTTSPVDGIPFKGPSGGNCFAPGGTAPQVPSVAPSSAPTTSRPAVAPTSTSRPAVAPTTTSRPAVVPTTSTRTPTYVAPTTPSTIQTPAMPTYPPASSYAAAPPDTNTQYTQPYYSAPAQPESSTPCPESDAVPTGNSYYATAGSHGGWKRRRHRNV